MLSRPAALGVAAALALAASTANAATVVLYDQNFESPNGFVNDGGDVNIFRTVNQLYGGQPAGFTFAQNFTTETLLVGGTQAFAAAQGGVGGFKDPAGTAGSYVLGMLSAVQNDLLGLAFNLAGNQFLNVRIDISSIDLDRFGGPFVPAGGLAPVFRLSLFDNPSGAAGVGGGTLLDSEDITGVAGPNKWTFDWRQFTVALDGAAATNGNVILQVDLLVGGYAAFDNLRIAASDTAGDVGTPGRVGEPGILGLVALCACAFAIARRRSRVA